MQSQPFGCSYSQAAATELLTGRLNPAQKKNMISQILSVAMFFVLPIGKHFCLYLYSG